MTYVLGKVSRQKLQGVHPDLVKVVERAIQLTKRDFKITCGRRTVEEQRKLVAMGKSRTMKSRHLTGHAVDMVPLPVDWDNVKPFYEVADAFKQAAAELKIPIVWGGDWKGAWDKPHFELDRRYYP